jgi:hypothetical protein
MPHDDRNYLQLVRNCGETYLPCGCENDKETGTLEMYANGITPEVGDVVGAPGLGDVLEVTPNGTGEYVCVIVQWRTPAMNMAQHAQPRSPVPIPAKSLTFIRRK